ncbi:phage/plasmid primase, P4 family, partial [Bacteriovoracaceae bacterium]|nr:phage/plasmid primase, P4 family [Bacteriovoracaceae bacterium]
PGNNFQIAFILFGSGENGKSVLLEILRNVLGIRNTCSVSLGELSNRFSTIQLVDKLANICDESPSGKSIESEMFKNITGGGFVTVEQKYKDTYMVACTAKQIFATNATLWIKDHTHALFRRLMIIPFGYKVPKEKRNNNLKDELMKELTGIINWSIEGYQRLIKNDGFSHCEASLESKEEFIRDMDSVKTFLDENCTVSPSFSEMCMSLYESYKAFTDENGYKSCSSGEFGKRMKSYYPEIVRERDGSSLRPYKYIGIALNP